jgi:hypothetical protein
MALDKFYPTNPNNIKFTLEVTKTLKEWKEIHDLCLVGDKDTGRYAANTFAFELKPLIALAVKEYTKYDIVTNKQEQTNE